MKYKLFAHVYDSVPTMSFEAGKFCVERQDKLSSIEPFDNYFKITLKDGTEHHFMERKFYLETWSKAKEQELGLVDYHREGDD